MNVAITAIGTAECGISAETQSQRLAERLNGSVHTIGAFTGKRGQMMFIDSYFSLSSMRQFWHDVCHHPDGKRGAYFKSSQRKRRKMDRRVGRWRKRS